MTTNTTDEPLGTLDLLPEPSPPGTNPFVGPRPYQPGERLFGRRRESRELFYQCSAERIVWLYSPSGAGKTSLISASLIPMLEREGFAVAPPIRLGLNLPESQTTSQAINPFAISLLLSLEDGRPEAERRSPEAVAELASPQGLVGYLRELTAIDQAAGRIGTVLILDQFEEILTLRPLDREAKTAFFQLLGETLRDPNLWALFALREEYLGALEPFVDWIPTRWSNTFRLDLLDRPAVLEVLNGAARQGGRTFGDEAVAALFDNLARTQVQQPDGSFLEEIGHHAEPVQLQVVCRRLWDALPADTRQIEPTHLRQFGDVSEALAAYYADAVRHAAGNDPGLERRVRTWCGERLVSPGGIRSLVRRGHGESEGLSNTVIADLLDSHLIRADQRTGTTWYELAHDRLVEPILQANAQWFDLHLEPFQRQAALWVRQGGLPDGGELMLRGRTLRDALRYRRDHQAEVSEDEGRLIDISRAARRIRRWIVSLLALLAVIIIAVAGFLLWSWDLGQEQLRAGWHQAGVREQIDAANSRSNRPLEAAHLLSRAASDFSWAKAPLQSDNALLALKFIIDRPLLLEVTDFDGPIEGAAYSSRADRILTWNKHGVVRLRNTRTGRVLASPLPGGGFVRGARFSPDGSRLLILGPRGAGLWDSETGAVRFTLGQDNEPPTDALFSPDGSRILTWGYEGQARIWDAMTESALTPLGQGDELIAGAAFSPDGSRILTWGFGAPARLWGTTNGHLLIPPLNDGRPVAGAAFSADGSRIIVLDREGSMRFLETDDGTERVEPIQADRPIEGFALNADGSRLLTWGPNGARLWDTRSGEPVTRWFALGKGLIDVRISRDGSRVLTLNADHTARVWDSTSGNPLSPPLMNGRTLLGAEFSPDERQIFTWGTDGTGRVWDASSMTGTASLGVGDLPTGWGRVKFSPDQSRIALWEYFGHRLEVRQSNSDGQPGRLLEHDGAILDPHFSRDGARILTVSADGFARLWDCDTGALLIPPLGHKGPVQGAQFSQDESRILTWSDDGTVRLWDSLTGRPLILPLRHAGPVIGARFSRDEARILSWSEDDTVRIWVIASGAALMAPIQVNEQPVAGALPKDADAHATDVPAKVYGGNQSIGPEYRALRTGLIEEAVFNRDESLILVTASHSVQVFDAASGTLLLPPLRHEGRIGGVQFSEDESSLLSWGSDGTARLWDAKTGAARVPPLKHDDDFVQGAQFSKDGSRVLTWTGDTVYLWDGRTGDPLIAPIRRHIFRGARFTHDDSRLLTWDEVTAMLWDSATGTPLIPAFPHDGRVGPPGMDPQQTRLRTWTESGGFHDWGLSIDRQWPVDDVALRVEVETGTFLAPTGEVLSLSPVQWQRERFCEYDKIRHDLAHIAETDWVKSEHRCRELKTAAGTPP
jgi:WD40 repeat protein